MRYTDSFIWPRPSRIRGHRLSPRSFRRTSSQDQAPCVFRILGVDAHRPVPVRRAARPAVQIGRPEIAAAAVWTSPHSSQLWFRRWPVPTQLGNEGERTTGDERRGERERERGRDAGLSILRDVARSRSIPSDGSEGRPTCRLELRAVSDAHHDHSTCFLSRCDRGERKMH